MPRSSRHKSSKHSSRDAKEYSDSEKESVLREKKGKEDGGSSSSSRHLKDLASGEKQKLDLKSVDVSKKSSGLGNAEYNDGYTSGVLLSSSRKRKEKVDDDRWTGGDDNNEHEMSKSEIKEKEEIRGSGESKRSSRRAVNYVSGFDVEEVKKSGSKGESKHHRSEKKDRGDKEGGSERERKGSRSDRSEKLVDIVSVSENTSNKGNRKQSGSGEEHGGKRSSAGKSEKVASEKWVDIVSVNETTGSDGNKKQSGLGEERVGKHSIVNNDVIIEEEFKNNEPERDLDRRVRRKRDGSGDAERHHTGQDSDGRRVSSREEMAKSGKYKDDGHKVDRHRDRFQEDIDKDIWRQDEKQRDNRSTRDYTSGKYDDKHSRNEKKDLDLSHKKSMPHGGEYDRELDRDRERDRDRDYASGKFDDKHSRNDKKDLDLSHKKSMPHGGDYERELDRDREQDRDQDRDRGRDRDRSRLDHDRDREHDDRDHDRDREQDRDYDRVHDRDRELDRDRDHGGDRYRRDLRGRVGVRDRRDRDYDRGRDRNFEHEHDNDYSLQIDEKGSRYKDDRGRRRSPDGYDDYHSDKLRRSKTEVDKERSLSQKPNIDSVAGSGQRRASPSSRSYFGADKYRDGVKDETKYGDSSRDNNMPEAERSPKYRSGEKRAKCDDNHAGEFSERSPNTRVSPAGFKERSPSSMSFDRSRFSSRNTRRRSLDVDDAERRISGSSDAREIGLTDDRQNLPNKKFAGDEYSKPESPFYNKNKSGQGNVSSHGPGPSPSPGPSVFRTRADSPSFVGSFGEDSRGPGNRYRRSVDPNVGRGHGNAWNGVPNWPSPLPNGLIPFPPGPPGPHHGGFPPMMSQFPPMYGVRPTIDMNHQGMPYHVADGDRFPVHGRPIAWPNMMDGPMPPHFHGWDAGNGNSSMYGPGPGHLAQRRDINSDMWKQNGDMNMEVMSGSQKHGPTIKASTDDASSGQGVSKANVESGCGEDQATSLKKDVSGGQSPVKELLSTPGKGTTDKTPESSGVDDTVQLLRAYLVKLDISMDLVAPELYNQCVNLAFKGDSECGEEVELELIEEKTVRESEITNLTVDMNIFPAAKESVFQRAMNLYKTQSSERRNSVVRNGDKIHSPPPSQLEVEQALMLKESIESPAACIVKQEEQTLVFPEEIVPNPTNLEGEDVKPVSMTTDEVVIGEPSQNSDFGHDVGSETQMPVLVAVKMEEDTPLGLVPDNVVEGDLPVEKNNPDPVVSNADDDILVNDAKIVSIDSVPAEQSDILVNDAKIVSIDSVPAEQSDILVSGPLNLCNDSVKVCEGLTSVSNESESVVLSRIHHAPESTH